MNLKTIPGTYAVAQLPRDAPLPAWLNGPGFTAMVRSDDELTLLCPEDRVPSDVTAQRGWACFRSIGPFAFDAAGILSSLIAPLSARGIGIFALCTFDGEHILCPMESFAQAQKILTAEGHHFVD